MSMMTMKTMVITIEEEIKDNKGIIVKKISNKINSMK